MGPTERLIRRTPRQFIVHELVTGSIQVPIALALVTLVTRQPSAWLSDPAFVPALAGGVMQAVVAGRRAYAGHRPAFLVEQIASAVLTLAVLLLDPASLPADPRLLLAWGVAVPIGALRVIDPHCGPRSGDLVLILEQVVRMAVLPGACALIVGPAFPSAPEHLFLIAVAGLLGMLLGMASVVHRRDRAKVEAITDKMRGYSELLLGKSMLTRALGGEQQLQPQRRTRAVLFADIRGFTRWSELRTPEEVLLMLDGYYTEVESACAGFKPVRTKHTADEVLMFFGDALTAARAALVLRDATDHFLEPYGLRVGVGLHHGQVIEGLFGSPKTKAYDILGDTVNTAKRICEGAGPGLVIVSFSFYEATGGRLRLSETHSAQAKGKSTLLVVAELLGIDDPDEPSL